MLSTQSTVLSAQTTAIGTLIAHHRSGRRILLSVAAEETGLNPVVLEAIEDGAMEPTLDQLLRIAGAFKMPLSELLADPNSFVSREHSIELPYDEYDAIGTGEQNVLILRNSHSYRAGDVLRFYCEEYPDFMVNVAAVHMCEILKSIPFRVPPGFVVVELSGRAANYLVWQPKHPRYARVPNMS